MKRISSHLFRIAKISVPALLIFAYANMAERREYRLSSDICQGIYMIRFYGRIGRMNKADNKELFSRRWLIERACGFLI